ncbi:surf-like protein [Thoreauomyces humboldtii]|nr:surf-like protein [Thoreauomyces humboldtii]
MQKPKTNPRPFSHARPRSLTSSPENEYLRIRVSGTFRHDREMLLGPRTRNDQAQKGGGLIGGGSAVGFFVITPFQRSDDGTVILVNRGWIPREMRDKRSRERGLVEGVVEIEALMRTAEKGGVMMLDNKPEKNEWYWLDMLGMTEFGGAKPILVEMIGGELLEETARNPVGLRETHWMLKLAFLVLPFLTRL